MKTRGGHLSAHNKKLCYVRIPRAASTSLLHAMLTARYPALAEISLSAEQVNFLADANLDVNISEEDKNANFFTVVRNPFSRIVSVYREFFERPSPYFLYEDYFFGILKKNSSLKEFVRTVEKIPARFMDQHIQPQHHFLSFYSERNIDVKTFKLEAPEPIEAFLAGHGLRLEALNRSDDRYDYRDYYDSELVRTVHKIYSEDIARFGYEGDHQSLRRYVGDKNDRSKT